MLRKRPPPVPDRKSTCTGKKDLWLVYLISRGRSKEIKRIWLKVRPDMVSAETSGLETLPFVSLERGSPQHSASAFRLGSALHVILTRRKKKKNKFYKLFFSRCESRKPDCKPQVVCRLSLQVRKPGLLSCQRSHKGSQSSLLLLVLLENSRCRAQKLEFAHVGGNVEGFLICFLGTLSCSNKRTRHLK